MAENIENKGFAVYNAETNRTGDEAMDAKIRKNIEYLIILLISAAVLAVGWSNRKTIAGWGNQNTEDTMPVADDAAEKIVDRVVKEISTGNYGDGKIFIYNIEDVVRIRTGEHGTDAL